MIDYLVKKQKEFYKSHVTQEYNFRMTALKLLYEGVLNYENEIKEALFLDLNKSSGEAYLTEIGVTLKEIKFLMKNLKKLMKQKKLKIFKLIHQ